MIDINTTAFLTTTNNSESNFPLEIRDHVQHNVTLGHMSGSEKNVQWL